MELKFRGHFLRKSAVDAFGGTVKIGVWTKVKSRTVNITDAQEFGTYTFEYFRI